MHLLAFPLQPRYESRAKHYVFHQQSSNTFFCLFIAVTMQLKVKSKYFQDYPLASSDVNSLEMQRDLLLKNLVKFDVSNKTTRKLVLAEQKVSILFFTAFRDFNLSAIVFSS